MSNALSNLQLLRLDMKEKGWCVTGFPFTYKQEKYSVVLELLEKPYKEFYTMLLTFYRSDEKVRSIHAHSNGLELNGYELSVLFGSEHGGGYKAPECMENHSGRKRKSRNRTDPKSLL